MRSLRNGLLFSLILLILAWALGSLARGMPGGSLLFDSYWLLYILYLVPFLALGGLILLVILIIWSWRDVSNGLGSGIARKLKTRKKRWAIRILIYLYAWAFIITFLEQYCGGLVCKPASNTSLSGAETIVSHSSLSSPVKGAVIGFSGILPWGWFIPASVVLFVACSFVMARSLVVSFLEIRHQAGNEIMLARWEASAAVQEAIRIISATDSSDPRIRIVRCFERLVTTASGLGTIALPSQTAREIETSIRRNFFLKGTATSKLTGLFEEARYSLHSMSEVDASNAREYLFEIAEELKS